MAIARFTVLAIPLVFNFISAQDPEGHQPPGIQSFEAAPSYFIANTAHQKTGRRLVEDASVVAFVQTPGGRVLFTSSGAYIGLTTTSASASNHEGNPTNPTRTTVLKAGFDEGLAQKQRPRPRLEEKTDARFNFFLGAREHWRSGLPAYQKLVYQQVWDGIDLEYTAFMDRLAMRWVAAPGSHPGRIVMQTGAEKFELLENGHLAARLGNAELVFRTPRAFQEIDGKTHPVVVDFQPLDRGRLGFRLGEYDPRFALIVDPELTWSTFLGGSGGTALEAATAIALDTNGNAVITGRTTSSGFPTTTGVLAESWNGGDQESFVTKLNSTGTGLVYSTFLGGSDREMGLAIALDSADNAFVTGITYSPDFPTTPGAFDESNAGQGDAFVAKLSADGSALIYSTFLGGSVVEFGNGIAVDDAGCALVSGETQSSDFPTTAGAFDETFGGLTDGFVVKLNGDGAALIFSTFLGGNSSDVSHAIALDGSGNPIVTGYASSNDFPSTPGAWDETQSGSADVFVTKLNSAGTGLIFSTFLGESDWDEGRGIAVDASNHVFITGETRSIAFPTTAGAFDETYNGSTDVFVTRLNDTGSALLYSTFLGHAGLESGWGVALDAFGNAHVTGDTRSSSFPTTPGAFDETWNSGQVDSFVTKLNADGSGLVYSSYLGGAHIDFGFGIAVDTSGNAFIAGRTFSIGFPTTAGAFQESLIGNEDAFITKLNSAGSSLIYSTFLGHHEGDVGNAIALDPMGNVYVTGETHSIFFPTTTGAFDQTLDGDFDVFVSKMINDGSALGYSTYLGGVNRDIGLGIAVNDLENAFVVGYTLSSDFPTTPGAFNETHNGSYDGFVVKLSAEGDDLAYSTFLGGSNLDFAVSVAVDAYGNAHVAGNTSSLDFPATPGAADESFNGKRDVFVARLNANGSGLDNATYLGGSEIDLNRGLALDANGEALITGLTRSSDFPTTPGTFDETHNGEEDVFVTRLSQDASALLFSTYLGGSGADLGLGIDTDPSGGVLVTGSTDSSGFPTTSGAYNETYNGGGDIFVTKLDASGTDLDYSTFLGGAASDTAHGIAVDASGKAYITGQTLSGGFPITLDAFDDSLDGFSDAFVASLNSDGAALSYATFLGGTDRDTGNGIALDAYSNPHVTGLTQSPDFPTTAGAFDPSLDSSIDAFVLRLSLPPCVSPAVIHHPEDNMACPGADVQFEVRVTGEGPFAFQWRKDNLPLVGEIGRTLIITEVSPADEGFYDCEVTGPCGMATSNSAALTLDDSLRAVMRPGSNARGLLPPVFEVAIDCAIPNVQTDWSADPPTPLVPNGNSVTLTPPPSETTLVKATVNDELERLAIAEGWLLVSANPTFFDFNMDGCNNLQDIWNLAPFWAQAFAGDPDDDGITTVLDFLYINTDDPTPCP